MKKTAFKAGILLVIILIFPIFAPMCGMGWSKINCQIHSINIQTGKARYSQYYWYLNISEEIKETPLSRAIEKKVGGMDKGWRRVNLLSKPFIRHSPHYKYHGALHQAHVFSNIAKRCGWSKDRKRESAKKILRVWQESGGYFKADEYLNQWMEDCWHKNN